MPTTLTQNQLDAFQANGILRLTGFYSPEAAALMAGRLWNDLTSRYGVSRSNPASWALERAFKFQTLVKSGAFAELSTPTVHALLDDLLGAGEWYSPKTWGQPLVTFPTAQPWDVYLKSWHTDYPATEVVGYPLPAVRFFVYLEPVRSHGGATLAVRGSHKAMMALAHEGGRSVRSADARAILESRSSWLRALFYEKENRVRRFMDTAGDLCGVPVQVEELTGEPGDLILMHPGMLHNGSPNVLGRPRMMLVQSVVRRDWREAITY